MLCWQGVELKQDIRNGIIMGNQSLVLQVGELNKIRNKLPNRKRIYI